MGTPKFSIVIPTLERADTLPFTLQTCRSQDFDDFEVVISDNSSVADIRKIVDEIGSEKCRYVRTPERLSMADSWDFAIDQARGEYVLLIGSDDGLMPFALSRMAAHLASEPVPAVRWTPGAYKWPQSEDHRSWIGLCVAPEVQRLSSRSQLADICAVKQQIWKLPYLYHGAVQRRVLQQLKQLTGRIFQTRYPDSYAGVACAHLCDEFLFLGTSLSLNGWSATSNTLQWAEAQKSLKRTDGIVPEFTKGALHAWAPDLPVIAALSLDSIQTARLALPGHDLELQVDRRAFVQWMLKEIGLTEREDRRRAFATIRATLSDNPELERWFDTLQLDKIPPAPPYDVIPTQGQHGPMYFFQCPPAIRTIADAAVLVSKDLNYPEGATSIGAHPIVVENAARPPATPSVAPSVLRRSLQWLRRAVSGR
jgi:hypothetical protein